MGTARHGRAARANESLMRRILTIGDPEAGAPQGPALELAACSAYRVPRVYACGGSISRAKCRCLAIAAVNSRSAAEVSPSSKLSTPGSGSPEVR